jgi:uncharacterized protein (TIRG00374 family)
MDRRLLAGVVISVVALAAIVMQVDLAQVLAAILQAEGVWIAMAFVFVSANLIPRVWRWSVLLRPLGNFPLASVCFPFYMIGFMANQLLPFHSGEFLRAYLFGRQQRISKAAVLATIVLERLFDLLSVIVMAVIVTAVADVSPQFKTAAYALETLGVGAFAVLWLLARDQRRKARTAAILRRLPGPVGAKLEDWLRSGTDALITLHDISALLRVLGLCFCIWGTAFLLTQSLLLAMDIDVPWYAPLFVIVVASVGMIVPLVPGNIGVAHLLYASALVWFGVEVDKAFAFALALHAIPYVCVVSIGLLVMWRKGFSLAGLAQTRWQAGS